MANKRDLKRSLNYACSEMFAECIAVSTVAPEEEQAHINDILKSILKAHSDFVRRISHPEPGMPAKKYYGTLIADFNNYVAETINNLEAIV